MTASLSLIYVSGSNSRSAAMEYNFGRTAVMQENALAAIPSMPSKVFAALQGLWLASDDRCKTRYPSAHVEGCNHSKNRERHTLSEVSRWTFGDDDSDHRGQVRTAIHDGQEAGVLAKPIMAWKRSGDLDASSSIAVLAEANLLRNSKTERGMLEFRFAPSIWEQLMLGRYQRLDDVALHNLSKSAWTMYREVFLQPRVHSMRPGQTERFGVTGRDPAIPVLRLGKAGVRGDRLPGSLIKDAKAINKLGIGYSLRIENRKRDGLNIAITRDEEGASSGPAGGLDEAQGGASSGPKGGHLEPEEGLVQAEDRAQSVHADGLETPLRRMDTTQSASEEGNPDLLFLEKHFRQPLRPNTDKLVRSLEREKKLSPLEAVEVMRAGVNVGKDPIETLKIYRTKPHQVEPIRHSPPKCDDCLRPATAGAFTEHGRTIHLCLPCQAFRPRKIPAA